MKMDTEHEFGHVIVCYSYGDTKKGSKATRDENMADDQNT